MISKTIYFYADMIVIFDLHFIIANFRMVTARQSEFLKRLLKNILFWIFLYRRIDIIISIHFFIFSLYEYIILKKFYITISLKKCRKVLDARIKICI